MRAVIQRTNLPAHVSVDSNVTGQIDKGLVVYLGISPEDTDEDIKWLTNKIVNLRVFNDSQGVMNLSLKDIGGSILLISQFTLYASTKKGNRPSYLKSAKPDIAKPLYERFAQFLKDQHEIRVEKGVFGADMKVNYTNDGPVTICIDTKNKE